MAGVCLCVVPVSWTDWGRQEGLQLGPRLFGCMHFWQPFYVMFLIGTFTSCEHLALGMASGSPSRGRHIEGE